MKKFIAIMLVLVLTLFSFAACNKDDASGSTDVDDVKPVEKFDGEKLKETWSAGEITFADGKKVLLPCTVKEFLETSGLKTANEQAYTNKQYKSGESFNMQLSGENVQIKIDCKNLEDSDVGYLDATVVAFNFFNSVKGNRAITVAAGLAVGITRAQVEEALGIPEGQTNEDRLYIYKEKVSDEQTIRLNVSFNTDDIVNSISYKVGK